MADVKPKSSKDEDLKRSYREKQLDNNEKSRSWERGKRSNSDDSYNRQEKKDKYRRRNRDRKVDEEEKYGEGSSRWSTNNYELNKCKRDRDGMDGEDYWIPGERGSDNYESGKKYKRSRARNDERPSSRRYIEHKCEDRDRVQREWEEEEVLKSKKEELEWEKEKEEWEKEELEWEKEKEEWARQKEEWARQKEELEKEKLERKKEWERKEEEWEWRETKQEKGERIVRIVGAKLRAWRSNATDVLSDWLAVPILEPVTDQHKDFCPYSYLEETTGKSEKKKKKQLEENQKSRPCVSF